jgi:hypothetical protein
MQWKRKSLLELVNIFLFLQFINFYLNSISCNGNSLFLYIYTSFSFFAVHASTLCEKGFCLCLWLGLFVLISAIYKFLFVF